MQAHTGLTPTEAQTLDSLAEQIRGRLSRTALDLIEAGQFLLRAKEMLPHGEFGSWLDTEFSLSQRTAEQFMSAARRFGSKSEVVAVLPSGAVLELAAPSVPDGVVEKVVRGEVAPKVADIREAVRLEKGAPSIRASKDLSQSIWALPNKIEDAARVMAKTVIRERDTEFAKWCSSTFARAAELIDWKLNKEDSDG